MTTNFDPIITNQQFRSRWVLQGLEQEGEQFRISSTATVQVRVKSPDGRTDYTGWQSLTHNSNREDDWALSTLDIVLSAATTAQIVNTDSATIDIRIQGVFVGRDGVDTTETYDKTWSALYPVEVGLA